MQITREKHAEADDRSGPEADRWLIAASQRRMAERAGSTVSEVAASHVSMVSHPEAALAAVLAAVASIDA